MWRWGKSGANSSLGSDPCSAGKIQGNSPKPDVSGGTRCGFSELFRGVSDEFPVIKNREFILTSRESAGIRNGL